MPDRMRTRAAWRTADAVTAYCRAFEASLEADPGSDLHIWRADTLTTLADCQIARMIADRSPARYVDAGDHDDRCAIWRSHDVEDCDCDDAQGYSPRHHQPEPASAVPDDGQLSLLPCETDHEDAAS